MIDRNIKLKIVIVDDSEDDHFFIKESLCDFKGISFLSFYDGEDFLKYLTEKRENNKDGSPLPDIAILDVNMPKLTGFQVFERVKELGLQKAIRFYILTTSLTEKDIEKCNSLNLVCHKKPFTIDRFSILLQKIIKDSTVDKSE
jgi:CheY-like chemotaxis protein